MGLLPLFRTGKTGEADLWRQREAFLWGDQGGLAQSGEACSVVGHSLG
jgi:hypothetical protein